MKPEARESDLLFRNIALACAIALPAVVASAAIFIAVKGTDGEALLDRYQTLIAGVFALVAAFIGGHFINKQILQTREQEHERLRRRHAAVRATMPLALSAIGQYAMETGQIFEASRKHILNDLDWRSAVDALHLPLLPGVISDFKYMIEAASAEDRVAFANLLGTIQIHRARTLGIQNNLRTTLTSDLRKSYITGATYDSVFLYAFASSLLSYARGQTEIASAGPTYDDLFNASLSMGLPLSSDVNKWIEKLRDSGEPPSLR